MDHCCSLNDLGYYVQQTAILGLGLIGAGTNNGRIARMLHSLSSYYYRSPALLFCVRLLTNYKIENVNLELLFVYCSLFADKNCSRSCTYGKGVAVTGSLPFGSVSAVKV